MREKREKREMREKEGKREKKREKREKRREKERKREKKRERERKGEKKVSRVNYYQSAFNSQKEKLNILAEMLKISKTGCLWIYIYIKEHCHYKSSCRS